MPTQDFSTWLTKQQAADAIGVSTKTIEKLAQEHQLSQAVWKPQGRGPSRAVYNPADVARIAASRQSGPTPVVLPADAGSNGHGQAPIALAAPFSNHEDARRAFVSGLSEFAAALRLAGSEKPADSQKSEKLFLTLLEAADVSGLPAGYLRRAIKAGTLPAMLTGVGYRIRRRDLEAL